MTRLHTLTAAVAILAVAPGVARAEESFARQVILAEVDYLTAVTEWLDLYLTEFAGKPLSAAGAEAHKQAKATWAEAKAALEAGKYGEAHDKVKAAKKAAMPAIEEVVKSAPPEWLQKTVAQQFLAMAKSVDAAAEALKDKAPAAAKKEYEQAKKLFQEARKLYDGKKVKPALKKFDEALGHFDKALVDVWKANP